MAKNNKTTQAGTNIQKVQQQNAGASSSSGSYGTEFASQTDVQQVKKQNQQSAQKSSGGYGQNSQQ